MDQWTNLDRHLRGSRRVDLSGVRWDQVADHPFTPAEVRCLTYMMDIEAHTMVFLRDLLATRVIAEPAITAFLACWVYEELWHGEALARFLGEAGVTLEPAGERPRWDDPYPGGQQRIRWVRQGLRRRPGRRLALSIGSTLLLEFPAVHMAWGAINELSTLTAYERLIAKTANPVLSDLLRRLIRDERRHYSFYRAEAHRRLEHSARARRLTRLVLHRAWAIVGTGVRPQPETDFVVLHLFGDEDGLEAARAMDATVHSLPGLAGLGLFERARTEARERAGGRSAVRATPTCATCPSGRVRL